jgi:hypothetical protein
VSDSSSDIYSDIYFTHSPANDASALQVSDSLLGLHMMPSFNVDRRYPPILFTAAECSIFGNYENRAHWWTANEMSGQLHFSR